MGKRNIRKCALQILHISSRWNIHFVSVSVNTNSLNAQNVPSVYVLCTTANFKEQRKEKEKKTTRIMHICNIKKSVAHMFF